MVRINGKIEWNKGKERVNGSSTCFRRKDEMRWSGRNRNLAREAVISSKEEWLVRRITLRVE